jgi:hypothetical protein
MYIIVGGLATDRKYFDRIKHHLNDVVKVYELTTRYNQVESLIAYLNVQRSPYVIVAFSLGCVLTMQSLPCITTRPTKIVFVNPSNTLVDTCVNKRPYEWIWRLPKICQSIFVYFYNKSTSIRLDEPPKFMNYILSKEFKHWSDIIHNVDDSFGWVRYTHQIRHLFKIKIISGINDRYHTFATILNDVYPETYSLKSIKGQHHIMYTRPKEIADSIMTN